MTNCSKCNQDLFKTGPLCKIQQCPWEPYNSFITETKDKNIFIFGEDHKFMKDVPYVRELLTWLIDSRPGKKFVFLFELMSSTAPEGLLYEMPDLSGGKTPILTPLGRDEHEIAEDRSKYNCSWSETAEAKGIVWQIPFLEPVMQTVVERFAIRNCFYEILKDSYPRDFSKNDIDREVPRGDHTRNDMLMTLAEERKIATYGIDLPGRDFALLESANALESPPLCQRFDYWNLLRDTWMSDLIAKEWLLERDATICAFVGADHIPVLDYGGGAKNFRFSVDGTPQPGKVILTEFACLSQSRVKDAVVYLEPKDYSDRQDFGLTYHDVNKWRY